MSAAATSYEPKPGSVAQRAIAHLESLEPGASLTSAALAEAIGVSPAVINGSLEGPRAAGVLLAHQRGGHAKSPRFWALAAPLNRSTARLERAGDGSQTPNGEAMAAVRPAKAGSDVRPEGAAAIAGRPATAKETTTRGASRACGEQRRAIDGAGDDAKPAVGAAAPNGLRIALWSDGELEIRRAGAEPLLFTRDETRELVRYIDRLALDDKVVSAS